MSRPLLAALILVLPACDFFKELQSEPMEETGTAGEDEFGEETAGTDDGTDDGPCDVLDERCADQDTLISCDYEGGDLYTTHCGAVCATFLNFTCIPTDTFQHACWCVSPGNYKLDACWQLEDCIEDCGDPASACALACFERTDATTIRLLGSLWHCADLSCDEVCAASPGECSICLSQARAGLWGDCGLERSVCDSDETDEPSWP